MEVSPPQRLGFHDPKKMPLGERTHSLDQVEDEARPTLYIGVEDSETGIEPTAWVAMWPSASSSLYR